MKVKVERKHASEQEDQWFDSGSGRFYVVCVFSPVWVLLSTEASSHSPKICKLGVRLIGQFKLSVHVSEDG